MDKEVTIDQQINKLRKQVHMMKKGRASKTDFLYSAEFSLMKQIAYYNKEHDASPTLVILSHALGIAQATVTQLVDRLIVKELIVKEISPLDKRAKLISLTQKGEGVLQHNIQNEYERLHSLLEYLGDDDTSNLIRILDKVIDHFSDN